MESCAGALRKPAFCFCRSASYWQRDSVDVCGGSGGDLTLRLVILLPAFVEELGVAAVIVAAQEGTVTNPHKAVLLEDPLHAVVVGQGRTADGCETQGVENVVYEEGNSFGSVASAAKVSGSDLYA